VKLILLLKNNTFIELGNKIIDTALKNNPKDIEELSNLDLEGSTIKDIIIDHIAKIGEKVEIKDYQKIEASLVVPYIHTGNNLGVLIGLEGVSDKEKTIIAGKDIAMQIAAMNPMALSKENIDSSIIQKELEIAKEQAKIEGKPEAVIEKIAQGKLNKFF